MPTPLARLCLAGFFTLGFGAFVPAAPAPISLAQPRGPAAMIVHERTDALSAHTALRLADYLKNQTGVAVPIVTADALPAVGRATTLIVLDAAPGHPIAARFGQTMRVPAGREDAYQLKVVARRDAPALVIAAGNTPAGVKYAAYRLMRELDVSGGAATVRPLDVSASPLIKTRSVALFNVWSMPIELTRRHNTESWPIADLERYLDLYDFYGFNAIESHDRFSDNYLEPLFGLSRADWRAKVLRMCDHAHENGQQFFLRIWGHTVTETPKMTEPLGPTSAVPKRLAYFCVNEPRGRERWEAEILHYYVDHYAGHIDHLIGHWCDPGVCRKNGCDYTTPLKLQMELHRAFKAVDPKFTSSFNLWFFDVTKDNPAGWARGGWPGYRNDLDLINAGILDRDVVIATATTKPGSYQDSIVAAIEAAGHRPAVWTWYRADHEIRPSLHVHLHERLGEYFRGLPPSARSLEWHNIERNVHGAANTANYYVAGRLMWEPNLDVDDLLREFLAFVFGPAGAAEVMPAYLALEGLRCNACYKNWENARFTGAGTADAAADLARAQAALDRLARVRIDPQFRPRVPLDIPPAQIVADLKASLEVTRDFARCRAEELPKIDRALAAGDRTAASRGIEQLQERYQGWTHTLAGRQEWSVLDALLKQKRAELTR